MKHVLSIFFVLGTLAIIGLGFFLPEFLMSYEDNRISSRVKQYETKSVQLATTTADLSDALNIRAQASNSITLNEGSNLTREQAIEAALLAFDHFTTSEALSLERSTMKAESIEPTLAVDEQSGGGSAIIWECFFVQGDWEDSMITISIDDATGKMVSFTYDRLSQESYLSEEEFDKNLELITQACIDYYGLSDQRMNQYRDVDASYGEGYEVIVYNEKIGLELIYNTFVASDQSDLDQSISGEDGSYAVFDISVSLNPLSL